MQLSAIILGLALGVLSVPAGAMIEEHVALADVNDVKVGMQLEALSDVRLTEAAIAKGSKVSVTKLVQHQGHVDSVAVELADGHVVKVGLPTVRSYFRAVE